MSLFKQTAEGKLSATSKHGHYHVVYGAEARKMGRFLSIVLAIIMICLLGMSYFS
jgi:hypothetical protein